MGVPRPRAGAWFGAGMSRVGGGGSTPGVSRRPARVSWPWPRDDVRHLAALALSAAAGSRTAHRSAVSGALPGATGGRLKSMPPMPGTGRRLRRPAERPEA